MNPAFDIQYGAFENGPVRYAFPPLDSGLHGEAWWLPGWPHPEATWQKMDSAEIGMNARPLSKAVFEDQFPDLPPLPKEAFSAARSTAARQAGG